MRSAASDALLRRPGPLRKGLCRLRVPSALTALAEPDGSLERLAPAVRQELAATAATLEAAIVDNQRALTAAKLATDQLVQSIAAAVVEEQRLQDQYHADGRNGPGTAPGGPVSVSINEVL